MKEQTVFKSEFSYDGGTYTVELRASPPRDFWDRRSAAYTRAYVWSKPLDNVLEDLAERASGERYAKERRRAERNLLEAALHEVPFVEGKVEASYSRTCGCSCGCSPGFVLKSVPRGAVLYVNQKAAS